LHVPSIKLEQISGEINPRILIPLVFQKIQITLILLIRNSWKILLYNICEEYCVISGIRFILSQYRLLFNT